ncbi:MAG: hypothetical protein E4H21_06330 [Thermodesulfobacteriales bacterium]|nr:MAG: hypothetical protein E4H21_06330 [Thermodesulfobacteriales bacterium]
MTEVYSSDGTMIGEFAFERRKIVRYENIPPHIRNAFIAIEDKRFFEHEGVDLKSIIGAMTENIQEGTWVRGASTITQQVIKNVILTPERTLSRKIKEAILAHKIENNLSKEEILFLYLNHIYLADGTYGVEMASQNYFGKSAKDINIAEAALLAGLPKKPEYFSPRKHLERALERQKLVLRKMVESGYITEDQRVEAIDFEIEIVPRRRVNYEAAPYFVEHVRKYLENKVGTEAFLNGGYKVFTTVNLELNNEANWAVKRGVLDIESRHERKIVSKNLTNTTQINKFRDNQKVQSVEPGIIYDAVVTKVGKIERLNDEDMQTYTAQIGVGADSGTLKYVVSSPFGKGINEFGNENLKGVSISPIELKVGDVISVKAASSEGDKKEFSLYINPVAQAALVSMDTNGHILAMAGGYDFENSQFNRATQALRQPGSAFKPIVYSAALDKGYSETSILYDMPVVIKDWAPQNYDGEYKGAIVLRQALAKSRNLATVRLMLDIDPAYVVDYSKNFGFTSVLKPYPSLALGGTDLKMMEMVKAYNVFASGGKLVEPQFILRIYDRNGRIIEDNTGGTFVSQEENLKVERGKKRLDIIKQLAKEQGRETSADLESLKEDILIDTNDFFGDSEYGFLTPNEFLNLIREGPVDFSSSEMAQQTLSPETAYIMADLLQAVIKEGTGAKAQKLTELAPVAGKTGTTNDYTDAWFVGFSPKLTTAVWVGRDDHKSLGNKEAGSRAALPIWIDFMQEALTNYPGGSFIKPSSLKIVSTPYGDIPYSVDSLRKNVLDSLRNNVMIDGRESEIPSDSYPNDIGQNSNDSETEIDFILNR